MLQTLSHRQASPPRTRKRSNPGPLDPQFSSNLALEGETSTLFDHFDHERGFGESFTRLAIGIDEEQSIDSFTIVEPKGSFDLKRHIPVSHLLNRAKEDESYSSEAYQRLRLRQLYSDFDPLPATNLLDLHHHQHHQPTSSVSSLTSSLASPVSSYSDLTRDTKARTGYEEDRIPEMDSPGRTSELSSSMCSTPSAGSSSLPLFAASRSIFQSATNGFTPCTSPSRRRDGDQDASELPIDPLQTSGTGLVVDLDSPEGQAILELGDDILTSSPRHRTYGETGLVFRSCLSRTVSSSVLETTAAGPSMQHDTANRLSASPPRLFTARSETETASTRMYHASYDRSSMRKRGVTFCEKLPSTFPTHPKHDYDRSPHPVVPRLTYRDVLELREMKVEMALVSKRQQGARGLTNETMAAASVAVPIKAHEKAKELGLALNPIGGHASGSAFSHLMDDDESVETTSPSPSPIDSSFRKRASASSFPSSIKLVRRLDEMGDFRPPARERGMGLMVEPTFGLDRVASGDSLRDDFARQMPVSRQGSISSLKRKTSGEFAVEESDFQKELRKAREELEAIAVQETRLGMASQLGGTQSNKGEQHSVAMGGSGTSTPLGLGIGRPTVPSNSDAASPIRSTFASSGLSGIPRSRSSSFAPQPYPPQTESSTLLEQASVSGLPIERTSIGPNRMTHTLKLDQTVEEDRGSLLFPAKDNKAATRPPARTNRPTLPPPKSRNAFRPPSPILAPYARSAPIRATTQLNETPDTAGATAKDKPKRNIFSPPSPILAPFARSELLPL